MKIDYLKLLFSDDAIAPINWQWKSLPYNYCNRLYYINGGDASYIDIEGTHKFKKGHLYFLPRNSTYSLTQNENDRLDHLYFDFICMPMLSDGKIIEINVDDDAILYDFIALLKKLTKRSPILSNRRKNEDFKNSRTVELIFTALFEYILDKINATPVAFDPLQESIIYMLEHFDEPITIEQLATKAGYHPKYFIKIFTSAMHITPYKFLRDLRINKAAVLINSGYTIQQAADAVGFQHASSLSNAIKDYQTKERKILNIKG